MIIYVYIRNEEEKNKKCRIKEIKKMNIWNREWILSSVKNSNSLKSLTPAFLFEDFVLRFLMCECFSYACDYAVCIW